MPHLLPGYSEYILYKQQPNDGYSTYPYDKYLNKF